MVRLITTDLFQNNRNTYEKTNDIEIFSYYKFEKYNTFVSKLDLQNDLYSLNLLSKKHLNKENFLIYINDFEYVICFDHKTIYSLKITGDFKINDIIKSVLITKNLIMLLSGGDINKVYYLIDSEFEELYRNILRENLQNEKGEYIIHKLGDQKNLIQNLPKLETKKRFVLKYLSLGVLIIFSIFMSTNPFSKSDQEQLMVENYKQLETQLNVTNTQLAKNQKILDDINIKIKKEFGCIQEVSQ